MTHRLPGGPTVSDSTTTPVDQLFPWRDVTTEQGQGIAQVFRWVAFNESYSSYFAPFSFVATKGARAARVITTITGHGNDQHGCGEFCATAHVFSLSSSAGFNSSAGLPSTARRMGLHSSVTTTIGPRNATVTVMNSAPVVDQLLGGAHAVPSGAVPNEVCLLGWR